MSAADVAANGRIARYPLGQVTGENSIQLYKQFDSAKGHLDSSIDGFAILIVRLRPKTYTKTSYGFSTVRRGSHIVVGLVVSDKNDFRYSLATPFVRTPRDIERPDCPFASSCYEFLQFMNFPLNVFDSRGFRCYCSSCYLGSWHNSLVRGEETYIIPRGWCRFGLHLPPLFLEYNEMWDTWPIAYHGTTPANAFSIVKHGQLLKNGDTTMDGIRLTTRASSSTKQNKYFVSPHICYASHPWYSQINKFRYFRGRQQYGQVVLAMWIRPGVYSKQKETEGGVKRIFDDYSIIPVDEIEWYSAHRGSVLPYGVLIRIFDDVEKAEIERLA
jgi:hypothetical protein